jgi:GT2 family glycosyltransferase
MAAPDKKPVDVSVVIVSFHCLGDLVRCVRSLSSPSSLRTEVIVVDNGSDDGTVEALSRLFPGVLVVPLGFNAGFSRANNVGIARATGRHVLVLNPDTVVSATALEQLALWLDEHPQAGVAAPRLVNPDGSDQQTARSFPTPSAALFGRRSPLTRWFPHNRFSSRFLSGRGHQGNVPFRVDWVSGAAMMVSAGAIAAVGAFDEAFFLFWEDADWCRRLTDAGYEVWTVPQATITHHEGSTRSHTFSPRLVRSFHRGAYLYWRKHHAPQAWNPARWLGAAALSGRAVAVMANEQRRARSRRALAAHVNVTAFANENPTPTTRQVTL